VCVTDYDLYSVPPRRLFVRLETSDGLVGWGEPVVEGRARTVRTAVEGLLDTSLVGGDPLRVEDHRQTMYRGGLPLRAGPHVGDRRYRPGAVGRSGAVRGRRGRRDPAGPLARRRIREVRKAAATAEAYDVALAPHCPLGPIALASCVQVDACSPNALVQEQSLDIHCNETSNVLDYLADPSVFAYRDGYVELPDGPGLGIEVDVDVVRERAGDVD